VSWAREVVATICKIILIEDREEGMTEQVKLLADSYRDVDRQLLRIEATFELLGKVATQGSGRLFLAKTGS
jgi:hypothetical protein